MEEKVIQCKAAVAFKPNEPLKLTTINVDPPKKGEVRVRILYTSVCHTDQYTLGGEDAEAVWPCILGHEGSGIVESVGEGVVDLKPGDHVLPLYIPQCKQCKFCKHPKTNLCSAIRTTQGKGLMPDGTSRFSLLDGTKVFHYMGTSTFSEYTVLPEISLAKLESDVPLEVACLIGCGVSTGFGAAINTAEVKHGDTVGVFGLGAVGLAVAVAAKNAGASKIIGIDINEQRLEKSKEFGVTETINPTKHQNPIDEVLVEMTDGGLDHTFACVGNVDVMASALKAAHRGWGQSVIIGVAGRGACPVVRPFLMITGRTWKGCAFGGWKSRDSIPFLVNCNKKGDLPVDKFITERLEGIEKIDEAFISLNNCSSLRSIIKYL